MSVDDTLRDAVRGALEKQAALVPHQWSGLTPGEQYQFAADAAIASVREWVAQEWTHRMKGTWKKCDDYVDGVLIQLGLSGDGEGE